MPASSMLMLILLMWSVPVLVYVVLFFPELKQAVVSGSLFALSRHGESENAKNALSFEYLLPMVAAATMALMFGLLIGASWPACLMLMGAGAALIGGIAYTLLQMHRLGIRTEACGPDQAMRHDTLAPDRSADSRLTGQRRMLVRQPVEGYEPYPHHENYPESPGEDQGQLTSHLSGSTPFFEELAEVRISWRIIRLFLARKQHRRKNPC